MTPKEMAAIDKALEECDVPVAYRHAIIEKLTAALAQNTQRCQPCDGQGNIMDMQCIGCDGTGAVAVGWKDESRAFLAYRLNQMADGGPLAFCADTLRDAASHLHAERARVPEFTPADAALLREAVSRLPKSRYDSGANLAFRFESAFAAPSQPKDAGEVCNVCGGDCAGASPPVAFCPMTATTQPEDADGE